MILPYDKRKNEYGTSYLYYNYNNIELMIDIYQWHNGIRVVWKGDVYIESGHISIHQDFYKPETCEWAILELLNKIGKSLLKLTLENR